QPEPDGPALRWNWDSALAISPHNSKRIYYGSQILFASDDRGDNWTAISPDLSRNLDRNQLKVMGRVWSVDAVAKNMSTSQYGTIVSVSESPIVEGLIYVGTDDGMVQVTEDGGKSWTAISTFGTLPIPEFGYINDIEADMHDADTVYVAINNHKRGDFKPYIAKSSDRGKTWENITNNLPERGSVYTIKQDHQTANLLFCGTEFGCFSSVDGGKKWLKLAGLPTVGIRDIEIQQDENDLVLASFGRGFYILDDYSPLREVDSELPKSNKIFPIKTGKIYDRTAPLAGGSRAFQGSNFYVAPNPPYGAAITYHLKDSLKTKSSERKSKDQKLAAAGKDTAYPTWEEFKAEDREVAPKVQLNIRDANGDLVKRLSGSTSKGLHRTHWDLRHGAFGRFGPLALPGKYTVDITQTVDGETTELVAATEFEIEPLMVDQVNESDLADTMKFLEKAHSLSMAVNGATDVAEQAKKQLDAIMSVIRNSVTLDPALANDVRSLELKLMDIMEAFDGDPTKTKRNEPELPGISSRIRTMMFGAMGSLEGPTGTHERQYDIARQQYEAVLGDLKELVDQSIPAINEKLDEAGAPWTPGRKIPEIK
ncbi:MAG: hypothetical protein WBD31_27080, partial [Rubripirellula sp.]